MRTAWPGRIRAGAGQQRTGQFEFSIMLMCPQYRARERRREAGVTRSMERRSNCTINGGYTHLEVCIHAQHLLALRLPEPAHYGAAEAALVCAHDDTNGVALAAESLDGLDGAVARVVVYDEDLNVIRADGGAGLRERVDYAGHERAEVAILLVRRDDDRGTDREGHGGRGSDGLGLESG